MVIHWLPLSVGLLLGLLPPRWLINCEVRYLRLDAILQRLKPSLNPQQRRRRWWKLPLVWIDPVRGFVAAGLLGRALEAAPDTRGVAALWPVLVTLSLLCAVLVVQTCGRASAGETIAPCSFLAGMLTASLPWIVALSVVTLGVTSAIAMRRFMVGHVMAAIATAVTGYFFIGLNAWLIGHVVLVALPGFIAWFRRRSLVMPMRT